MAHSYIIIIIIMIIMILFLGRIPFLRLFFPSVYVCVVREVAFELLTKKQDYTYVYYYLRRKFFKYFDRRLDERNSNFR